jgi:flavin-dependent dehydrogenase
MPEVISTEVAIIGAGPGGSTCAGFLRKHDPKIAVDLFEQEVFPRDHVGESQLPVVTKILHELGVWDRIEACNFPIKIGGTYRWGSSDDLWNFDFLPYGNFEDEPRPGKFQGQREHTAFQVDRSIYDKVLADYAEELGCRIHYRTRVREVVRKGDVVERLILEDGTRVQANYYIDASGHVGLLRRAMGVPVEEPSSLKNIALWDYWHNAEWAVSLGIGGTRIQVLSLGYGWIWFIPISQERTSIGFVCPADYYKQSGLTAEQLYTKAIQDELRLSRLLANATREGQLKSTKDWSFIATRMSGKNWFLVGESAGFADPILSAGLSLTHASARELASLILEAKNGGDFEWMCDEYYRRNAHRVRQHIRFADYWYTANSHFSDLKAYTAEIARDSGLTMTADEAFRWLGTGGFVEEDMEVAGFSLIRIDQLHVITGKLSGTLSTSAIDGFNLFLLRIKDVEEVKIARFGGGRVQSIRALERGGKVLPLNGLFGWMIVGLEHSPKLDVAMAYLFEKMSKVGQWETHTPTRLIECLDAMIRDGWVKPRVSQSSPVIRHKLRTESSVVRTHEGV